MTLAKTTTSTVVPAMRYDNATAMIDWLTEAFGLEKHLVVPGPDGRVIHAELAFGNGMIMLGSVADTPFGAFMAQPAAIGGRETQTCYLIVADADAHYARAKAAGAEILIDIKDEGYGRGYTCRDPEGHIWSFGTYDPWHPPKG